MQFDFERAHVASMIKKVNGTHIKVFSRAGGWIQVPISGLRCEVHDQLSDLHSVLVDTDEEVPELAEDVSPATAQAACVRELILAAENEGRLRFFFDQNKFPIQPIRKM